MEPPACLPCGLRSATQTAAVALQCVHCALCNEGCPGCLGAGHRTPASTTGQCADCKNTLHFATRCLATPALEARAPAPHGSRKAAWGQLPSWLQCSAANLPCTNQASTTSVPARASFPDRSAVSKPLCNSAGMFQTHEPKEGLRVSCGW